MIKNSLIKGKIGGGDAGEFRPDILRESEINLRGVAKDVDYWREVK